jgi:hypothetical protein
VDERLRRINMEYDKKRESKRLGPMALKLVTDGAFDQLRREIIELQRGREEQYKHAYLVAEHEFVQRFNIIRSIHPG